MAEKTKDLPNGTYLDGYVLEKRLGGGGFSVVYRATEVSTGHRVVIKEHYPARIATRTADGRVVPIGEQQARLFNHARKLFFQEASMLASLKHPNIVEIVRFFSANGTIYIVMDYAEGVTLRDYLAHRGTLSEEAIRSIFIPLLGGLRELHAHGLLHLDIKPGNIYLRNQGGPLLLDFGAAHKTLVADGGAPASVVTHGFSPPEQSRRGGKVGPWSDLYAVAAAIRNCMEGRPPPSVKDRVKNKLSPVAASLAFKGTYSAALLRTIDQAMALRAEQRPQDVDAFLRSMGVTPGDGFFAAMVRRARRAVGGRV